MAATDVLPQRRIPTAREQFAALPPADQVAGIAGLASSGHSVNTIAHATGLSVEAIQRLLDPPTKAAA